MIACMPLLSAYSGSTAMYLPRPLTWLVMDAGSKQLTALGSAINVFATVDTEAFGQIINLGPLFLVFMGLQVRRLVLNC
jgi:hypothetical protein